MLHDFFHGFHFVDADRLLLDVQKIADEDGFSFLVNESGEFLEFIVIAFSASLLQRGNGFGIPCMAHTIATPMELTDIWKEGTIVGCCFSLCFVDATACSMLMECFCVLRNFL